MKAEEYLEKLPDLVDKIADCEKLITKLKAVAEKRTSNLTPDKVQASGKKDKVGDNVCSYVVVEKRKQGYEEKRKEILDTIDTLPASESRVIYQRYVNDKFLNEIANDIGRSYSWVAKKHRSGLRNIQKMLNERKARD